MSSHIGQEAAFDVYQNSDRFQSGFQVLAIGLGANLRYIGYF